jgi:hypothetical protein
MRILFILFFLLLLQLSFAQSAGELERQFTELQMQIETGQIRLDSLKALLEKQAARIEAEKSKTTVDRNKVTKLMAEGIPLTDEIAGSQEQLSLLQQEQAQTRYLLAQRYSAMLDSLKTLENSHSGDADEIRKQIVYYTEKYLLFSPVFNALSFDPQKIRQINLSAAEDSLHRAISVNYLQNALTDINRHLTEIKKSREELEATIRLERKTREFLEEVRDENLMLLAQTASPTATENLTFEGGTPPIANQDANIEAAAAQVEAMALFFDQLDLRNSEERISAWKYAVESGQVYVSLEEYLVLLQEAEEQLRQYHSVIHKKLEKH